MANKKVFCRQTYTKLLYYCDPVDGQCFTGWAVLYRMGSALQDGQCFTGWTLIGLVHDGTCVDPLAFINQARQLVDSRCITAGVTTYAVGFSGFPC
jgi:hypothetical protein